MQPSDKELDKLAREAAEKLEAAGAVPDWDAMRVLLETELPEQEDRRRRPMLWFIILLFLGAGGYLFINSPGDTRTGGKPVATKNNNQPSTLAEAKATTLSTLPTKAGNPGETSTTPDLRGIPVTGSLITQPGAEEPTNGSRRKLSRKKAGKLSVTITAGTTGDEDAQSIEKPSTPATKEPMEASTVPSPDVLKPGNQVQPAIAPATAGGSDSKQIKTGLETSTDIAATSVQKTARKKQRQPYEISVVYAPELTTIGFSDWDKPGSSYGLLVGYHLSEKLMVQTGLIKSKKNYTANGEDYKLHYTVPYPYKLTEVTGFCNMYEVPVNVKHQITNSKKINTAIIAGLSSYFMTRESYVYKYSSPSGSYDRNVLDDSQKNYWFSLATIGVGFEKDLSKSIKAGATPYIKIPFTGMGTGELKLISTGINFSVTYRPSFTR